MLLFLPLFFYSCDDGENSTALVEYKGALKEIMYKGDLSSKADLLDYKSNEHLYGLGVLEN